MLEHPAAHWPQTQVKGGACREKDQHGGAGKLKPTINLMILRRSREFYHMLHSDTTQSVSGGTVDFSLSPCERGPARCYSWML